MATTSSSTTKSTKKTTTSSAAKAKTTKTQAEVKETPKAKVKASVKDQASNNLVEEVISKKEVKYLYPEDCEDTLARKKFRQEVRNKLKRLELNMRRVEDTQSKEFRKAEKAYNAYKATVIKPEAKVS